METKLYMIDYILTFNTNTFRIKHKLLSACLSESYVSTLKNSTGTFAFYSLFLYNICEVKYRKTYTSN